MIEIKYDAKFENNVAYDKAWALASIGRAIVIDSDANEGDSVRVFQQAKTNMERAIFALQISEAHSRKRSGRSRRQGKSFTDCPTHPSLTHVN